MEANQPPRTLAGAALVIALATGLLSGVGAVITVFSSDALDRTTPTEREKIAVIERQLEQLRGDLYREGEPVKPVDSGRVVALEEKQAILEQALKGDPTQVLSIAMLRRDLEELGKDLRQIERLEQQIAELRQTLLWVAGSLIAILLAAVGWLLTRSRKSV